jgi:hypothetical protein
MVKPIITSLFLLLCFNLSAQWKPSVSHDYKSNESVPFKDMPQAEINLGIHKFGKQHRTGNHLMIAGLITTTLGSVLLNTSYSNKDLYGKQDNPNVYKTIIGLGSGLLVAGFIVNIDSFRHLK